MGTGHQLWQAVSHDLAGWGSSAMPFWRWTFRWPPFRRWTLDQCCCF